jgi:ubiquitin-protein ligase E3 C
VTFVNKHGQQEAGIDGGGVFKEFLDDLIRDAFLPETVRGESVEGDDDDTVMETHPDFFSVTPLQTLTVNTALDENDSLSHYEFLGRVLGKAVYGESSSLSFCRS